MSNASIDDLIARLESATEGSRELDAEIACALHILPPDAPGWLQRWSGPFVPISYPESDPGQIAAINSKGGTSVNWAPLCFTESLDAAVSLIPDHLWWCIAKGKTRPDEPMYGAQILGGAQIPGGARMVAEAETDASAAMAICIAVLKSRKP